VRTTMSVEMTRTSIGKGFSNAIRAASRDASPGTALRARLRRMLCRQAEEGRPNLSQWPTDNWCLVGNTCCR